MNTGSLSRRARGLARAAGDLVLPAYCAGCGARGAACCADCGCVFDTPCSRRPPLSASVPVYTLARYGGVARALVLAHKERGRRDLAEPLAARMATALPLLPGLREDGAGTTWLVPAPSRRRAVRTRGGSHTHALARHCARRLAGEGYAAAVAPALRLAAGASDAVGLDRAERVANLSGRVAVVPAGLPSPGTPLVLLDDVVTTGATVAACARELGTAGYPVTAVLALTAAC